MKKLLMVAMVALGFAACQSGTESSPEKSIDEIKAEGRITNSDIIRNPVTADEPTDTVNVAKMVFDQELYNFGEVDEGDIVKHTFTFTNSGKQPLLISNARSTCGCTVPQWPREPIAPGEKGEIKVEFNTKNKKNAQTKPITITANTYPATTKVSLKGFVKPKEEEGASK